MKRLEMLKRATQRACDLVEFNAALGDVKYRKLRGLEDEQAVELLAYHILREAAEGKDG